MKKEASTPMTGNDRFEGFGIELIDKLSQKLGFNYTFILQEDGAYGSLNRETGEWNGMLREIMDGRADLAITDLTITSERESATDFTTKNYIKNCVTEGSDSNKRHIKKRWKYLSKFGTDFQKTITTAFNYYDKPSPYCRTPTNGRKSLVMYLKPR